MIKKSNLLLICILPLLYSLICFVLIYTILSSEKQMLTGEFAKWKTLLEKQPLQNNKENIEVANNLKEALIQARAELNKKQEAEQQEISIINSLIPELSSPEKGKQYGYIIIDRLGMKVPLFYGDDYATLKKGAGQYIGSSLPGAGSQILIAAHNTNYFKPLEYIANDDYIQIVTNFGVYEYAVKEIRIAEETDSTTYNLTLDYEQLVLYTCYPFYGPPGKTHRYFVYADRVYD